MGNVSIQGDQRWDVFFEVKTHEEFVKRFVPTIYLHPNVNNDTRGIFDSIQRQLIASYFDYELVDTAAQKAVINLEMALKLRYFEIHREVWKDKWNFQQLLKYFQDEGYFEIDNVHFFDWLRAVRNQFAHPTMHSFGGLTSMRFIFIVTDLINDLYENRVLRKFRKTYTENINTILSNYVEQGATIQLRQGVETMFYRCSVGFVNNAVYPNIITIVYKPIFPIPQAYTTKDEILLYYWQTIACNDLIVCSDKLIGLDDRRQEVFRIAKINEAEACKDWNAWKSELDAYRQVMRWFDHADYNDAGDKCAILKKAFHERNAASAMI